MHIVSKVVLAQQCVWGTLLSAIRPSETGPLNALAPGQLPGVDFFWRTKMRLPNYCLVATAASASAQGGPPRFHKSAKREEFTSPCAVRKFNADHLRLLAPERQTTLDAFAVGKTAPPPSSGSGPILGCFSDYIKNVMNK